MSRIIIVTGVSGIEIKKSLENYTSKYAEFLREEGGLAKPYIIKLDDFIIEAFYELFPKTQKYSNVFKDSILKQSYPILEKLWNLACDKVQKEIDRISELDHKSTIIINLHSCYYHKKTQEYLSLIDISKLKAIEPIKIVTFIDDIYDIHQRLTKKGGIYHDEHLVTKPKLVLRLMRLLDWRAKETMMSKFIAKQLDIEHCVLAIKHPFETFTNLILKNRPKVYLSHPITEVRRLEASGLDEQVKDIMGQITDISELLTYNYTAFLPTTIDEYRIKYIKNHKTGEKRYLPKLGERWENELYKKSTDKLFLESGFNDNDDLWNPHLPETEYSDEVGSLLEALAATISDQVTTRDYTLVEQSDILVIYRPVFNGNASGGVREEFRYYKKLQKDTNSDIKCFVYCPEDDLHLFYKRQFEFCLIEDLNDKKLEYSGDGFTVLNEDEYDKLKRYDRNNHENNSALLMELFDEIRDAHHLNINITIEKTPLSQNQIETYKSNFVSKLIEIFRSVDDYKEGVTYYEDQLVNIEDFINNIKLKNNG